MTQFKRLFPIFLFVAFAFIACEEELESPEACFSIDPTEAFSGDEVKFNSCSTNADSYAWDFGDGNVSDKQNPTHEYAQAGTYTVMLVVNSLTGTDHVSKKIVINERGVNQEAPKACFAFAPEKLTTSENVKFTSCSDNATSHTWNFGDGKDSDEENPTHRYAEAGTFSVTLTVSNATGTDEIKKTVTVTAPSTILHTTNITKDETWSNTAIHIVEDQVRVDNAVLTIEPGTVVKFMEKSRLMFGYNNAGDATLIANGTETEPIVFTSYNDSPKAGDWSSIGIYEHTSSKNSMKYCTVEYGGIVVEDAELAIENCVVQHSSNYGIKLNENSSFTSFKNNKVKDCEQAPVYMHVNHAHTLGEGNVFETTIGIWLEEGKLETKNALWRNHKVPYILDGRIQVGNANGNKLTIEPGTTLAFTERGRFECCYWADEYATIIAKGTAEAPITFTSFSATPEAGDWGYIFLNKGTSPETVFEHCVFEYGGGFNDNYGMIVLEDSKVALKNTTLRHVPNMALSMSENASFITFENNTISNTPGHAMLILPNAVHTLGAGNNFEDDNGILIDSGKYTVKSTWIPQNTRYVVSGRIIIGTTHGAELTITPGTTIAFQQSGSFHVGYWADEYGKFVAKGTDEKPIIFTSAFPEGSKQAGQWRGIFFNQATNAGSTIDNCIIEYAGNSNDNSGAIGCDDVMSGQPHITNNIIRHSSSNGIRIYDCNPHIEGNTFVGITANDID